MVDDLARRLRAEGLAPSPWSNGPGDRYAAHEHDYDKVIVVSRGSIRFGLAGRAVDLASGDRLELPAVAVRTAATWQDETDGPDKA
jgi:quercetin dioxygenase-like cupin family protein